MHARTAVHPSVLASFVIESAQDKNPHEGSDPVNIPWIPLIVCSFLGVLIYTILVRRRRRSRMHETMRLINEGSVGEAVEIFERVLKRDKSDVIAWFHLALCRELSGNAQGAREIYESIADDPRVDYAAHTRLAELQYGRLLDATRLKALERFEVGVGLLADGNVNDAAEAFNEGAALHPAYRPVHYYLGACAEINARPNEALEHYRCIRQEEEKEPTLVSHRIMAVEAQKLWTAHDAPAAIALRKAWNYLQMDYVERAVEELETLVRKHPHEYTAHFGLALCHILTGMPEAAREHYELVPPDDFRYDDARRKLKEITDNE